MQKNGFNQGELDKIRLKKENTLPNNFSNQNPIPNGADLKALGKGFFGLVKKLHRWRSQKTRKNHCRNSNTKLYYS